MLLLIVRFVISAIVLLVVSFILPGFAIAGFGGALLAALVIALLSHFVTAIMGRKISPQRRGIVGFIMAAIIIYVAQFLVAAMTVSIIGAVLAAFIIGIADSFLPTILR